MRFASGTPAEDRFALRRAPGTPPGAPVCSARGPGSSSRSPVCSARGPGSSSRGPVCSARGPGSSSRGPVCSARGPGSSSRSPVCSARGPGNDSRGSVYCSFLRFGGYSGRADDRHRRMIGPRSPKIVARSRQNHCRTRTPPGNQSKTGTRRARRKTGEGSTRRRGEGRGGRGERQERECHHRVTEPTEGKAEKRERWHGSPSRALDA
ncbi:hypothetical protein MNBD_PLANCTO03-1516 [hydrothermal vent metagenome]|uniref:Uncharacterized protein n=1 Tax=hydrothermal vent metagenome TaxID=652676 RepID=A0A3B1DM85_9ZZZZ